MMNKNSIRQLRKARGWTRREMASYFGVNLTTILRWENHGIPSRGLARKAIEREMAALKPAHHHINGSSEQVA